MSNVYPGDLILAILVVILVTVLVSYAVMGLTSLYRFLRGRSRPPCYDIDSARLIQVLRREE